MARKSQFKLIDGPTAVHNFNGGFRVPADLKRREVKAGVQWHRSPAFKQKYSPTKIAVWIDRSADRYDERGRRKPKQPLAVAA